MIYERIRNFYRYIIAQILGAYVACLLIYTQWHDLIKESEAALASVGMLESTLFTPNGPAGAFGLYTLPGLNLGRVFLNEFVTVNVHSSWFADGVLINRHRMSFWPL